MSALVISAASSRKPYRAKPVRADAVPVHLVEVGDARLRRVDVALHLDQGGRQLRPPAVRVRQRLRRILPPLAAHLVPARAVLDVAVAIRVAIRTVAPR